MVSAEGYEDEQGEASHGRSQKADAQKKACTIGMIVVLVGCIVS